MTIREQLVREIEQAPDALVEELLDFYQRNGSKALPFRAAFTL